MCNFSDGIEQDAMQKGIQQGREEGKAEAVYELVRLGVLSPAAAAASRNQTEEEFNAGMASWAAAIK